MNRVLEKFLESTAIQVRSWAEDEEMREDRDRPDLNGYCARASGEFSRRLARKKVDHEIHMSVSDIGCHVYVVVDDYIYDVTATQFPEYRNQKVLIKHVREAEVNWYHCSADIFKSADELRKCQQKRKWQKWQIAHAA